MHGDRLDLQITPKGYRVGVLTGKLATFKQQRDNPNPKISEWMHAEADKLIYNEEKDTITLINNARLTRTENGVLKRPVRPSCMISETPALSPKAAPQAVNAAA